MKTCPIRSFLIMCMIMIGALLITAGSGTLFGQSSAGYRLIRHVMGNGGQSSTSASYKVSGTAGQAMAGPPQAGSSSFRLNSGFWGPTLVTPSATPTATSTSTLTPTAAATVTPTATLMFSNQNLYLPGVLHD